MLQAAWDRVFYWLSWPYAIGLAIKANVNELENRRLKMPDYEVRLRARPPSFARRQGRIARLLRRPAPRPLGGDKRPWALYRDGVRIGVYATELEARESIPPDQEG